MTLLAAASLQECEELKIATISITDLTKPRTTVILSTKLRNTVILVHMRGDNTDARLGA